MSEIYKKVAIVIPTHKAKLNSDEEISVKCLDKNLNNFDKYLVCPQKIDPIFPDAAGAVRRARPDGPAPLDPGRAFRFCFRPTRPKP